MQTGLTAPRRTVSKRVLTVAEGPMADNEDMVEEERNKAAEQGTAALQTRRPADANGHDGARRTVSKRLQTVREAPMADNEDTAEEERSQSGRSYALPHCRPLSQTGSNGGVRADGGQ